MIRFITIFLLFTGLQVRAQENNSFSVQFTDSLQLQSGERYISNVFLFKNKSKDSLFLHFNLKVPYGWQGTNRQKQLTLSPGEEYAIPVNMMPQLNTPAEWMPFSLQVRNSKVNSDTILNFWGKTAALMRFKANLISKEEQLSGDKRDVAIKLLVSNTGNVNGNYTIQLKNYFLNLQKEVALFLKPNTDTIYNFSFTLSTEQWKGLKKEVIAVKIIDTTEVVKLMLFDLSKAHSNLKQNRSAFQTIPLELEMGGLLNDKQLTYFGNIKGKFVISEKALINFSYRTKEMGAYNQIQNDVVSFNLATPKLTLYAGQITDAKNFIAFGNGIKASYLLKGKEIYFAGTLHNNNFYFKNDQFEVGLKHELGKIKLDQSISGNLDGATNSNSYLFQNKADIFKRKDLSVSVSGGVGIETNKLKSTASTNKPSLAGGYDAFYTHNKFQLVSNLQINSRFFPGLNKGYRNQNHTISWRTNKLIVSTFFQSNQRLFSVFRDSIYNSDFLSYNTQRLGIYTGFKLKKMNLGISTGQFGQYGSNSSNSLDKYQYIESFYFWQPSKKLKANFSTFNGYGRVNNKQQDIWINSTAAGIYTNRFGLTGMYTKNPQLISASGTKRLHHYNETMNLTPSMNFSLMTRFFFNLSYTVSQTSYDEHLTSYGSGSFSYIGKRNGLSLSLYGVVPITKSNAESPGLKTNYFTLSLKKKFEFPLFFKRKFYNLKVVPFIDMNNNERKDAGENSISQRLFTINATSFLTNKAGSAVYRNIKKGNYTIDFTNVQGLEGFVPAMGNTQIIKVDGNKTVPVPFKKSKIISGSVSVALDSLSNMKFTPDGIKVIAKDSSGKIYSALTKENGTYTISVPANVYTVSLNPEAFDDKLKPEIMAFSIDLTNKGNENVNFIVKQQKRKVRLLKN